MQAQVVRVLGGAATILALAVPGYAKAPLERVSISGGGLAEVITVADQETLHLSNPWYGKIADWRTDVAPPPDDRPVYEITLHARIRGPEIKPIYQLRYVEGKGGAPGSVY